MEVIPFCAKCGKPYTLFDLKLTTRNAFTKHYVYCPQTKARRMILAILDELIERG